MTEPWRFQVRVYLGEEWAEIARTDPANPVIKPLADILGPYQARLKCQYDSFAEFVAAAESHDELSPLYHWTKVTLADPEKVAKHRKAFAVTVAGETVYAREVADELEAGLMRLVDGLHITRVSKQDTNPANNMPVPDEYRK